MSKLPSVVGVAFLALIGGVGLSACAGSAPSATPGFSAADGNLAPITTSPNTSRRLSSPAQAGTVGEEVTTPQPLVVRTGSATLGVTKNKVVTVFDKVSGDADSLGGYVQSSSSNSANDAGGATLVVRVPSANFAKLISDVDPLGKVQSQSENGQDVTGETIDLQAQLANLKSEESALRSLVAKATSVASILTVQNQLFSVEGDIEQLTAQANSLADQVTYSTFTVNLVPVATHVVKKAGRGTVGRAASVAARNSGLAVRGVIYGIGWAFPAIVLLVLALLARAAWRRRDRRPAVATSDNAG
ncbi:MAG: DUF4349 domain-containing protein [Acidimicrobiales bacterium]